ncbi:MAG TPA: hypothetical protein VJ723_12915, partial [Candidatus Angelobacter sp.]|nr:hypothetical protein [Candidatus Angelobacter sp.]
MAFSFLQRGNLTEFARQLSLASDTPSIALANLIAGIDNVRHDVVLSPKFSEVVQQHIFRLIARYGAVEDMASDQFSVPKGPPRAGGPPATVMAQMPKVADPADYRRILTELHMAAMSRAKKENSVALDLLLRLAVAKFQRAEMVNQYSRVL